MCDMPRSMLVRFMKKMGARRVEREAIEILATFLDTQAELAAKRAITSSQGAKRKTVTRADMELAVKSI